MNRLCLVENRNLLSCWRHTSSFRPQKHYIYLRGENSLDKIHAANEGMDHAKQEMCFLTLSEGCPRVGAKALVQFMYLDLHRINH